MTFINQDIPTDLPPIEKWKFYIRKRDYSIHQSPYPVQDAIEVANPPGDDYTWDFNSSKWILNLSRLKAIETQKVQDEYARLRKFDTLDPSILQKIESALADYREALRLYIKNYAQGSKFPLIPDSLSDESFYNY